MLSSVRVPSADRRAPGVASRFRVHLGNTKLAAGLAVAYLISQAAIGSILRDVDPPTVLRLQTTLSADIFSSIVEAWHAQGLVEKYLGHYWFDFPHAFLYSALLASLLALVLDGNRFDRRYDWLLLVPFAAGALDLVENLCHVIMLATGTGIRQPLVAASGIAANLKWLVALGSLATVGALFLRARFNGATRR